MPKNKYISAFCYLFQYIKPYRMHFFGASLISLLLAATGLVNAKITQMLIDYSITGAFSGIMVSSALFLYIIIITITLNYISGVAVAKLAANASRDLKRRIADTLLCAKYKELIRQKSGDVLSAINSDTNIICAFLSGDLIGLFSQFAMAASALVYVFCFDPLIALITFAYTPLGMFFTLSINKNMNRLHPQNADSKGEALSVAEQALSQIPVIKSFLMEKRIRQKIFCEYDKVYTTEMKISIWNSLLQSACSSTSQIPRILFIICAGFSVMNGSITVGSFIAIFDLLTFIIGPTVYFPFILNSLNKATASMNRIKRLGDIPQAAPEPSDNEKPCFGGQPSVEIHDLSFGYDAEKPVLRGFCFSHTGPGIIALCGTSGSGKTTLLDLIAGLYVPDNGTLCVRGDISVVSQDAYLFRESVLENVRLANPRASDGAVREALGLAGAVDFVSELPHGYDTLLGDGNTELSGGQRQRISLARTILQDSAIWLLDEPTSALDAQTESSILHAIKEASKSKLIILSTHRQSVIQASDRVILLRGVESDIETV